MRLNAKQMSLVQRVFRSLSKREQRLTCITETNKPVVYADIRHDGFCMLNKVAMYPGMLSVIIVVTKAARRKGLATAMLKKAWRFVNRSKFNELAYFVMPENEPSVCLVKAVFPDADRHWAWDETGHDFLAYII